jgi:diguanylate cyclase (GGDEF)-like protein
MSRNRFLLVPWSRFGILRSWALAWLVAGMPGIAMGGLDAGKEEASVLPVEKLGAQVAYHPHAVRAEALARLKASGTLSRAQRLNDIWRLIAASREIEENDESMRWVDGGIALAVDLGAHEIECSLRHLKGSALSGLNQRPQALAVLDEAVACAERHAQARPLIMARAEKARALRDMGQWNESLKHLNEVYKLAESHGLNREMGLLVMDMLPFYKLEDPREAREIVKLSTQAFALFDERIYRADVVPLYHNLARAHYALGEKDKALQLYAKGRAMAEEIGYVVAVGIFSYRAAGIEREAGQIDKALVNLDRAFDIFMRTHNNRFALESLLDKAAILADRGQLKPSLAVLEQARGILLDDSDTVPVIRFHREAARLHASAGDFTVAYRELLRMSTLERKQFEDMRNEVYEEQRARFEVKLRDQENALLKLRASQAASDRLILIASVVLLVLVLGALGLYARQQIRQKRRLAELAMRDELTQVRNRRSIVELARGQLQQALDSDVPLCVGVLDIDHFKRINDGFGHNVGDAVLIAFAQRCESQRRSTDSFGRYGGEEFLLVMPGMDIGQVASVYERLRQAVSEVRAPVMGDGAVTFSMGAAQAQPGDSIEALIQRADAALYQAKRDGRDRLAVK